MPEIGVRELKAQASQIIRNVRERRARYVITHRGRPVGLLLPLDEAGAASLPPGGESAATAWEELTRLGEEIGRGWRSSLTSTELLSEMRR
ncbi:MAG: type II toxin-antitoxin system Phd/YefM family antitoxin [Anaerolineae bacterium]|nr:type II toxin-antitoxin system Phd/YefM family antitoxin [Anaerolineae bacterium]